MTDTRDGRILLVDHTAVLGGAQLSLLDVAIHLRGRAAVALFENGALARKLVGNGVAILPIAIGDGLRDAKKESVIPSPRAAVATVRAVRALVQLAKPFAVICANSPKSFLVSAIAGALAGKPVVWHLRDILDESHFSAVNIRLMVTAANASATRIIANSQATANAFTAAGGRSDITTVVYNGVDAAPFDTLSPEARSEMRRTLGIAASDFVVGSFSRLHPWKGQQVLLDAIGHVPDVHALVVGGALFSGEGAFESELRYRASQPPLAGRVAILGPRDDVPALMNACDVIAHTSVAPEPFGRVLVEGMLAERAVIATNAGGAPEVVTNEVTGLLVPPGDARALAAAITRLRADVSLRNTLTAAGAREARERFSRERMVAGVSAVLDDVIARSRV